MNSKQNMINELAERTGESKATVTRIIEALSTGIAETLAGGNEVSIHGVGKLVSVDRKARTVNSPMTGGKREIPASKAVKFKPSKTLKDAVN